jgi:hypothetical protein
MPVMPGDNVIKLYTDVIYKFGNKLECLPLTSLMFVGKAGAYRRVEKFKCTSLGLAPGLSCKYCNVLKRPVRDKHSSLLQK